MKVEKSSIWNGVKWFGVLACFSFLIGCSGTPSKSAGYAKSSKPVDLNHTSKVKNLLLSQYRLWEGTPYQYGGTTRSGVDCSAFVQNTYRSKLGYQIPRTTRTQIKLGSSVSKRNLKPGDIVFFKTGSSSMHNGIYLGKSKFVHASSSKGVTISSLDNRYWQKTYLTSKRIR